MSPKREVVGDDVKKISFLVIIIQFLLNTFRYVKIFILSKCLCLSKENYGGFAQDIAFHLLIFSHLYQVAGYLVSCYRIQCLVLKPLA